MPDTRINPRSVGLKEKENSVFILGGGRIGLAALRDLAASPIVDHIEVGDIDTSKAEHLAKELRSRKIGIRKVDLTNRKELILAISHSRVLINATWYEYNVDVMEAAFKARVHYLDMGGLFHVTRKQLAFDRAAKASRVIAVIGAGESPGMTNIMCAASAEEMNSTLEAKIRVGGREVPVSKSAELVFPFAVSTVFDEY